MWWRVAGRCSCWQITHHQVITNFTASMKYHRKNANTRLLSLLFSLFQFQILHSLVCLVFMYKEKKLKPTSILTLMKSSKRSRHTNSDTVHHNINTMAIKGTNSFWIYSSINVYLWFSDKNYFYSIMCKAFWKARETLWIYINIRDVSLQLYSITWIIVFLSRLSNKHSRDIHVSITSNILTE